MEFPYRGVGMRLPSPNRMLRALRERAGSRPMRSHLIPWLAGLSIIPAVTVTMVTAISFWRAQTLNDGNRVEEALTYASRNLEAWLDKAGREARVAAADVALTTALASGEREAMEQACAAVAERAGSAGAAIVDDRGGLICTDGSRIAGKLFRRRQQDTAWTGDSLLGLHYAAEGTLRRPDGSPGPTLLLFTTAGPELCIDLRQSPDVSVALWPQGLSTPLAPPGLPLTDMDFDAIPLEGREPSALRLGGEPYLAMGGKVWNSQSPGAVRLATVISDHGQTAVLLRATWLNLATLGSVLLVAIGAGATLARRVADPIDNLASAADALARGDFTQRARPDGPKEFRDLIDSFNTMAGALEERTQELVESNRELDRQMARVRELNGLLRKAVRTDSLTQVGTHGYIQERLTDQLEMAQEATEPLSVLMVDVDFFKNINDTYGHPTGDRVLKEVAQAISEAVRRSDLVGRHGGDEFCIVLPWADEAEASRCAERIRAAIAATTVRADGGAHVQVGLSIGAATFPADGTDAGSLLAAADRALYQAKRWRDIAQTKWGMDPDAPAADEALPSGHDSAIRVAEAMAASVDGMQERTIDHSHMVAERAAGIAETLAMTGPEMRILRVACLVHDIGKAGTPGELLAEDGDPSQAANCTIDSHDAIGARLLEHLGVSREVVEVVHHHHERFDGCGRPDGLGGEEIPPGARTIAVAQSYVRLTTASPAGEGLSPKEALANIQRLSGKAYDPKVVAALGVQLDQTLELSLGRPQPPAQAIAADMQTAG